MGEEEGGAQPRSRGPGYSYNLVVLIGRLTRNPEVRYTPSGTAVANFTLAVDRAVANQAGERQTDFIDVECWQRLAENAGQYLTKGRLVLVQGELHIDRYQTPDGQQRRAARVRATLWRFLQPRGDGSPAPGASPGRSAARSGSTEFADEPPAGEGEEEVPF